MIKKSKHHITLIIFFLLLIQLPLFIQVTGIEKSYVDNENRIKEDFPKFDFDHPISFVRNFKSYYKDNFGLRNFLSSKYFHLKREILNENPIPLKVIEGKDNFLFLGNSFSNVVNESLGFSHFNEKELNQKKKSILEKKLWLEENNIKLYIAVVENKQTVYEDKFPIQSLDIPKRKEQLISYIKKEIDFDIIDLCKDFKDKKKENRLYRKYDSHWNGLGAFYGSRVLINRIKQDFDINQLDISNYTIDSIKTEGNTAKMINIMSIENKIILKPNNLGRVKLLNIGKYYSEPNIYESRYKNPNKKFKILLFRDSFASDLIPFLNTTFGECTYIWSHKFDRNLILSENPDIVIMEYVERYLERI